MIIHIVGVLSMNFCKVKCPNLGHFFSFCLPINGTSLGKLHNRPSGIVLFAFTVWSPKSSGYPRTELSDFVHVIHIANFWGVVPNSGHFHKLTDSTQDCLFEPPKGLKMFPSTHGRFWISGQVYKCVQNKFYSNPVRTVKITHVEAPKPAEEATDNTVQWFSALLHQPLYQQQV